MFGSVTDIATWPFLALAPMAAVVAFGIGWLFTRLGVGLALRPKRRADEMPWPERARLAFPARFLVAIHLALVPLTLGASVYFRLAPELGLTPTPWSMAIGLAGALGVLTVGEGLERRLCRPSGGQSPTGISLPWLLVLPGLVPLALMLAIVPTRWGWLAIAVLASGAVLMTFQLIGIPVLLLRRLGIARPASPRLASVVDRSAAWFKVRPRAVFELASPNANAMAWLVPRYLIFTRPFLDIVDDDELMAVTAHELGHLDEPRAVLLTRVLKAYLPVIIVAGIPLGGSFGLWAGLAPLALVLVVLIVHQRIARRMEERSDRLGKGHEGDSNGAYARALAKLYEANLMPVVMPGKRQVHPHLYDRLIAAGSPPDYPRPAPPRKLGPGLVSSILLASGMWWVILGINPDDTPRRDAPSVLAERALKSFEAGDLEAAARLYRRAARLDATTPHHAANLAAVLLHLGRLDEADRAARRAEAALGHGPNRNEDAKALIAQVRAEIRRRRATSSRTALEEGP